MIFLVGCVVVVVVVIVVVVVVLFVFVLCLVPNVACFSGLSILDCPFCLLQKPINQLIFYGATYF